MDNLETFDNSTNNLNDIDYYPESIPDNNFDTISKPIDTLIQDDKTQNINSQSQNINSQTQNINLQTQELQQSILDHQPFDNKKFNKAFNTTKDLINENNKEIDNYNLQNLNRVTISKPLYDYTIIEIFIGIKDSWFDLFDDLMTQKFSYDILTKNFRSFFIGLTCVIVGIILYLFNFFNDELINVNEFIRNK